MYLRQKATVAILSVLCDQCHATRILQQDNTSFFWRWKDRTPFSSTLFSANTAKLPSSLLAVLLQSGVGEANSSGSKKCKVLIQTIIFLYLKFQLINFKIFK
jgi:hypothetical protein